MEKDQNVLVIQGTLTPLAKFSSISDARKALKGGSFGEGTFNILSIHDTATVQSETVQRVKVESQTFRSRAPRKPKAEGAGAKGEKKGKATANGAEARA